MEKLINEIDGIIRFPKKTIDKKKVIQWLSTKFELDKEYSEKEVNKIIELYHSFNDTPLLRRELISQKYLKRENDGSKYWKTKTPPIRPNRSLWNKSYGWYLKNLWIWKKLTKKSDSDFLHT